MGKGALGVVADFGSNGGYSLTRRQLSLRQNHAHRMRWPSGGQPTNATNRAVNDERDISTSAASMSHQLTRMGGRGLIERENGEGSGVVIAMTAEGRRQLAAAKPVHTAGMRRYFLDHLSPDDLSGLRMITNKLRTALLDPSAVPVD